MLFFYGENFIQIIGENVVETLCTAIEITATLFIKDQSVKNSCIHKV